MFDVICLVAMMFGIIGMIMTDSIWFVLTCLFGAAMFAAKEYGRTHSETEA